MDTFAIVLALWAIQCQIHAGQKGDWRINGIMSVALAISIFTW